MDGRSYFDYTILTYIKMMAYNDSSKPFFRKMFDNFTIERDYHNGKTCVKCEKSGKTYEFTFNTPHLNK